MLNEESEGKGCGKGQCLFRSAAHETLIDGNAKRRQSEMKNEKTLSPSVEKNEIMAKENIWREAHLYEMKERKVMKRSL